MDAETLKRFIEDAGYETRSYSGRCMYGKSCIGFVTSDSEFYVGAAIVANIEDECDRFDLCEVFHHAKVDSMGRDIIIYFPNIPYEEKYEEEEE